jgi:hypothetical protein
MKKNNIALILNEEDKYPSDYNEHFVSEIEKIPTGSCDNVYVGDIFDRIEQEHISSMLKNIVEKVKIEDGLVHIKSPDILQLSWYTSRMNLDVHRLRYVLYQTNRKNCYTLEEMIDMILSVPNIGIVNAHYENGYEYSITINRYEN